MSDDMQEFVAEAKKSKFSTIPNLSEDDVVSVWENVASFIERHMSMSKGVHIPGLGTFTFSQKKLDIGNNKFVLMQRPVFVVSEKFAQVHNLQYTKYFTSGQIPIVQLNYVVLSTEGPFDRDIVTGCVKEIILAISRAVQAGRNVEFTFVGIGKLSIRDGKVKMKFFKDFMNMMDGSGHLSEALRNRPDTTDSVISRASVMGARPGTGNTLVLPRITQNFGKDGLALEQEVPSQPPMSPIAEGIEIAPQAAKEGNEVNTQDELDEVFEEAPITEEDGHHRLQSPVPDPRPVVPTAKAVGISLVDDLLPPSPPKGIKGNSMTPSPPNSKPATPRMDLPPPKSPKTELKPPRPPPTANRRSLTPPGSACGHSAGQELCYLCHQRAANNIPVSFHTERKRKEQEQDRLLQQYQHMKDTEAIIREQAQNFSTRHHAQKIASFNLGVSEAIKNKQRERPLKFQTSYIFQHRPLTPPRQIIQDEYASYLAEQVESKAASKTKNKQDQDFLERLEQVQLAEELAAQREQFLRDKAAHTDMYQRALSAQVKIKEMIARACHEEDKRMETANPFGNPIAGCGLANLPKVPRVARHLDPLTLPVPKIILPFSESEPLRLKMPDKKMVKFKPLPLPAAVPDSKEPIFGKYDATNEQLAEKRRRAIKVYQEQLAAVEQEKKLKLLRHLKTQREETDMLDRTKKDLMEDRAARYDHMFTTRKSLEESWRDAAEMKRKREEGDQLRAQSPGVLLHEQCDKYNRCDQCQRRLGNCGESNIWSESRYIPGSRLIV